MNPSLQHEQKIEEVLREHYFASYPQGYLESEWGRNDLRNHIDGRLGIDRRIIAPWLDSVVSLSSTSVLEIGCGTGSSTVALAELGAKVTAVDIDEPSLKVARERCRLHQVEAELITANAADLPAATRAKHFDLIIFYASLEHMTMAERLDAILDTWAMLASGGLWSVIDTPNRLWYFDSHTSLLPFFMWLPDDLAFHYSRFSDRPRFNDLYRDPGPEAQLHFLRRGRGVSYHDLEVVMGKLEREAVAGWLDWRTQHSWWRRLRGVWSTEQRYVRLLRRVAPDLHEAFLQPTLDFVIRK